MNRKNSKSKKKLSGKGRHVGIVVSDFNNDITQRLLRGAEKALLQSGVLPKNIVVVHVPGGFEIPLACQRLARSKKYDSLIALGAVIKGETDHYYYISSETSGGIESICLRRVVVMFLV